MMPEVRVVPIGPLKDLAGRSNVVIKLEDDTSVKTLFHNLGSMFGEEFKRFFIDIDDPRMNALILVNGVEISLLHDLNTKLQNQDVITLIPVTHGG